MCNMLSTITLYVNEGKIELETCHKKSRKKQTIESGRDIVDNINNAHISGWFASVMTFSWKPKVLAHNCVHAFQQ